jgi:curved DNA-binding protein CbpA
MVSQQFLDHYETLEVSSNASGATIERVFRYLAKKHHPDVAVTNDPERFKKLVQAYEVVCDPASRAAYDRTYENEKQVKAELVVGANSAGDDCLERYQLLSMLYAQRKRNFKKPGIGISSLELMASCPPESVNFHVWYFKEKHWVGREECGQLSITALGVDYIESMNQSVVKNHLRIEHLPQPLPTTTPSVLSN